MKATQKRNAVREKSYTNSDCMTLTGFARCVSIFVVALALNGAVAAPARSQEIKSNGAIYDLKDIIAEGKLRVAFANFDVPGFRRRLGSGEFYGPEFELAKDIAKTLNLKLVIVNGGDTFDALAKTVADLKADLGINRMSASFDRAPYVRFSQPYAKLRHAMVYNRKVVARLAKGGNPEDAIRAFSGRIGVIGASSYVEFAKESFPAATIVEVKSWDDGVKALRDETIDGLYRDEFEVRRVLEKNPDMGVPFGSAVFTDKIDFKVIYICNPCTNLQQLVNLYIESNQQLLVRSMSVEALLHNARQ